MLFSPLKSPAKKKHSYFEVFGSLSTTNLVTMSLSAKDKLAVKTIFDKVAHKAEDIGSEALARCLIVYPWTQRYFASFGNLSSPAAIMGNPKVAAHGRTVMGGLERAIKNMDNIKATYAPLSVMHSEKLHVDPDNFRLLADCITVCAAMKFGPSGFSANVQEAWQKFLSVVVSALCRQYH
uniref:Hemoglobin subunit beta-like n=1 Tax=Cyprinus carpio TaxID=7962 RepID=A0A8C2IX81_CYPCA